MSITAQSLIAKLPPYQDQWEVIHPNQTVKDIMREVLEAHNEFAPYYDEIALCFDDANTGKICENIYQFLKTNIRYKEETEHDQTSALPTGILTRQQGDCKHYASFAGGILDALNRSGRKIKWRYVFASYKIIDDTPHHVFIEVDYNGENFWIDPTPGSDVKDPAWVIRKKIKADMALRRNIAGINDEVVIFEEGNEMMIGKRPFWQLMPVEGVRGKDGNHGTNHYFTGPFLALQHYLEDPYSVEGTDWNTTANAINAAIATGPAPGHTVNGQFVKWVYDHSMKGWNFYYPMGVQEDYVPNLPNWYPHLIIDNDGKLVFDKVMKLDDYMNDEIHAITAWAQSIINEKSPTPYPITPRQVKEYSQGKDNDLFTEDRGQGFLKDVFGFLQKIAGIAPRNAYLSLVGINAFGMATKLKRAIYNDDGTPDPDGYTKVMSKWENVFGGNAQKLQNTINDGASKKAIMGNVNAIGGPEALAAWLAAAAPIIAIIDKIVDGILGKKKIDTGIDYQIDPHTGQPFPPVPLPNDTGFNGIIEKIKANPLPVAALTIGGYLLLRKKKRQVAGIGGDLIPIALIVYGVWYFFLKPGATGGHDDTETYRAYLIKRVDKNAAAITAFTQMTATEILNFYNWVISNPPDNIPLPPAIAAIFAKYGNFLS